MKQDYTGVPKLCIGTVHNKRKELVRMGETDFNEKFEDFLNSYVAEKINEIRKQHKDLVAQKAALAQKLESCEAFWAYEE